MDNDEKLTLTGVTFEDVGKYRVEVEMTEDNGTRDIELVIGGNKKTAE